MRRDDADEHSRIAGPVEARHFVFRPPPDLNQLAAVAQMVAKSRSTAGVRRPDDGAGARDQLTRNGLRRGANVVMILAG